VRTDTTLDGANLRHASKNDKGKAQADECVDFLQNENLSLGHTIRTRNICGTYSPDRPPYEMMGYDSDQASLISILDLRY
jgi:hypothetical protein